MKTLHPIIHGGILAKRDDQGHQQELNYNNIDTIDLVIVNLYPFAETITRTGVELDEALENIDIGGPALIRAAAKNHAFVTVIVDPADYVRFSDEMIQNNGTTTDDFRTWLAAKAYARTAAYDVAIANWFASNLGDPFPGQALFSGELKQTLRYGENPHQEAAFYIGGHNRPGVGSAKQLQGKELSFNNLNDTDAAFELAAEFTDQAACVIVKHANPCGVAIAADLETAYKHALICDTESAFGGIIAFNRNLDAATAQKVADLFAEVNVARLFQI